MTFLTDVSAAIAPTALEPVAISIDSLGKRYGTGPLVLDDINLSIEAGQLVCLLGASGCG